MINVNQITSQLAKMPDPMLQKFAAMHKNDPYTIALALAESNRRKEIRAGAQMHAAGQEMPKVVDQEVAQMAAPQALPEDVGIAKLPAQNIQSMAGGGIVAFEEGGKVPRYQDQGLVRVPSMQYGFNTGFGNASRPGYTQAELVEAQRLREMGLIDLLKEKFGPAWQALTTPPAAKVKQETYQSGTDIGGPGSSPANMGAPATAQTINFQNPTGAPAAAATTVPATPTTPAAQPAAGLPSINAYMKQFEMALPKKEEAQSEETFMNKREEPMKAYFDKANKQIETERARLKSDKEQDFYMSLIQGGLAAAAESGPNALQNIAKGFSTGAASYKDALKDFRKASQENAKMEMDLMKAQAADKKGDMDAYQKHTEAVAERNSKIDQYKTSGVASLLGHKISADASITAAGIGAAASRDLANSYRAPAFAEQIRQHLAKELDSDPRYKYDATAKAVELQRRLEQELKKYPGMAQYAGAPGGGGAVDTTGFKVIGSRPSQ